MAREVHTTAYVAPMHVRLTCGDPALDVTCWLGADAPKLTAGVGGWDVTARPREVGMTVWQGVEPYELSLSLMFDGWATGASQEGFLRALTAVARGDNESPPGILAVDGIPLPADSWVIDGIDFGDPIATLDGQRVRQALTLTLREYVPPEYLKRYAARSSSSTKGVVVRAKRGDTPAKIAKRRRVKWTDLRKLNKFILRANQVLKEGTKVRVPKAKR